MINYTPLYLDSYVPDTPKIITDNFAAVERHINLFYDASNGIIIKPLRTTGTVEGTTARFVNGVFDNLAVRKQFTNIYENTTTVDSDFYNTYTDASGATTYIKRDASVLGAVQEHADFSYIDLDQAYYRMTNDVSLAFASSQLGQEFRLIWDPSSLTSGDTSPFTILLDPYTPSGDTQILSVAMADASTTWIKLIAIDYDVSRGMAYMVKEYTGTYTISTY